MTFRLRSGSAVVVALLALALAVAPVLAGSTTWKLSSFNTSGRALRSQSVAVAADGAASFTFPKTADAAYLLSSKAPAASTGLSATASITTTGGTTFAYYPEGAPAMVGLYFQTKSSGGFDPSDYWWSTSRITLDSIVLSGSTSMAASFGDGSQWTNFYGKPGNQAGTYVVDGTTYPSAQDGFAAAVANVSSWGVTFGGGSFYANGVGTPTGSAVFTLTPTP